MDTSEQYIKMCEMAFPDLIEIWKWDIGDFFSDGVESGVLTGIPTGKGVFPLPRQDQLQEMVKVKGWKSDQNGAILIQFFDWYQNKTYRQHTFGFSFEQLWLHFVMKEKFNKTWNGEDWV